jgi:hypothetical protein
MRVAFPTSIPTIRRVDSTSVFVGFDALMTLMSSKDYIEALHEKKRNGARLVQFGGLVKGLSAEVTVVWKLPTLKRMIGRGDIGVVVFPEVPNERPGWYLNYQEACDNASVSVIAIASRSEDGATRISFLKHLVDSGMFCSDKQHWLYGVPNPAELGVYPTLFSNYVLSKIELAICSTCFLYSVFGILFSTDTGVVHRLGEVKDTRVLDLGLLDFADYEMSREQMRCFYLNAEMTQAFASGEIAGAYMDRVSGIL